MIELLKFFVNPTVIVAIALTWVGTATYHGVTEWINRDNLIKPWAKALADSNEAIAKRDEAVVFKDQLIEAVSQDKERAYVENNSLREQLEKAEATRRAAGVADCVWSANDRRMLNRGTRAGAPTAN